MVLARLALAAQGGGEEGRGPRRRSSICQGETDREGDGSGGYARCIDWAGHGTHGKEGSKYTKRRRIDRLATGTRGKVR